MAIQQLVCGRTHGGWDELTATDGIKNRTKDIELLKSRSAVAETLPVGTVTLRYLLAHLMGTEHWVLLHTTTIEDLRPGAYVAHCLSGSGPGNQDFLPIELWGSPDWVRHADSSSPVADPLRIEPALTTEHCRLLQAQDPLLSPRRIGGLIDHFLDSLGTQKRKPLSIIGQNSEQIVNAIRLLSFCLPAVLVQRFLTFSTCESDSPKDIWLHGRIAGQPAAEIAGGDQVDLTRLPADRVEPKHDWTQFYVRCLEDEGLSWPALTLARDLYDFAQGEPSRRLRRCADTASWVFMNASPDNTSEQSLETAFKFFDWKPSGQNLLGGIRNRRVNALVDLQQAIWPRQTSTPGSFTEQAHGESRRHGFFGRDSKWWIDLASQWVNTTIPYPSLERLQGSYLAILELYWDDKPGRLARLKQLDVSRLEAHHREVVFRMSSKGLLSTNVDTFFFGVENCLRLGKEHELAERLLTQDCQEHIRQLSDGQGFLVKMDNIASARIRTIIQQAQGSGNPTPGSFLGNLPSQPTENSEPLFEPTNYPAGSFEASSLPAMIVPEMPMVDPPEETSITLPPEPVVTTRRSKKPTSRVPKGSVPRVNLAPAGFEALRDPKFLPRLAAQEQVTQASSTEDKARVRELLWQLAKRELPSKQSANAKALFDVYFWVLWQAQQSRSLLDTPEKLLASVSQDLQSRKQHRRTVQLMLRKAFASSTGKHHVGWLNPLFNKRSLVDKFLDIITF